MQIAIADETSDASALARLFARNLSPQYISHGELQGHRALRPHEWVPDIEAVLRREIQERLQQPLDRFPHARNWRGVVEAHENETLVALAFVTLVHDSAVPHGVIEDIVVDQPRRSAGLGERMMRWIMDGFRDAGAKRAFLESGHGNEAAHHLFERLGFKTLSIVMMRDL